MRLELEGDAIFIIGNPKCRLFDFVVVLQGQVLVHLSNRRIEFDRAVTPAFDFTIFAPGHDETRDVRAVERGHQHGDFFALLQLLTAEIEGGGQDILPEIEGIT